MAFRYLIYRTDYNFTVIRESSVSGTTGVNEGELYTNFPIPVIQPLYYWRIDTDFSQVQPNSEYWISEWENFISPPAPNDFATLGELTGITTQIQDDLNVLTNLVDNNVSKFNAYTGNTGLQQITEIGATTDIETSFENGVVIDKFRPSIDSYSAITFNNADGATPYMIFDTISGRTGVGVQPQNKLHIFGSDTNEDVPLIGIQQNGVMIDGVTDADKDVAWADNGNVKWLAEIYRGEEGKFWYLYNQEGNLSPITVSEGGRIGINSLTDIVDYGAQTIGGSYSDYNKLKIGGVFDKNYITVYEILINNVTGNPNTYIWRKSVDNGFTFGSWSVPTGCTTGVTVLDSGIEISFIQITGFTENVLYKFTAFPQLAPATLSIDGNRVNAVLISQNYSADPVQFLDVTANANTSDVENPLPIFATGTTLNAAYIGAPTKMNSVFINIVRAGAGLSLVAEYWNGNSWIDISVGSDYFWDGTNQMTRTGSITWDTSRMTGWVKSNITEHFEDIELYWIRLRTSSPATNSPLIGGISRGTDKRFAVYSSAFDAKPAFYVDAIGRINVGGGNISGCNKFQINTSNYVDLTTGLSNSLLEIDSNDSDVANIRVRSSSNDSIAGGYVIAKTRGTLNSATNICSGDSIGHVCFRGRVNNVGTTLSIIESQYVGNSNSRYSDILFKTSSGTEPTEKIRISNLGTGFGVTNPTAIIHLKEGSASVAPLKFTGGQLTTVPQAGAVEYSGDAFYGTTGTTRKTFAFLESPQFTGVPVLPIGTEFNNDTLYDFILNSGGTNVEHVEIDDYKIYTGATNTRLNGIDADIDYVSGQTNTKLPITVFADYTGNTIPWTKIDKTNSSLADLTTRNSSDVSYADTDWNVTNVSDMLGNVGDYLKNTQISGRITPETVLVQTDLNSVYVYPGNGYIMYDNFAGLINWSGQTIDTSGYHPISGVGTYYVYVDTNSLVQISRTESNNIHNIRLGSFYWALQVGNVKQDGGVIANSISRTSDYFKRLGTFIYDDGGNVQMLSANTTTIISSPAKIQMSLMSIQLPEVATRAGDVTGMTMMINYVSADQGVNIDFSYVNNAVVTGDYSIPTTRYNDPTEYSSVVITGGTVNFTQYSNVVTSTGDLTGQFPTGTSQMYVTYPYSPTSPNFIYEVVVTGVTYDGSGTTLYLAQPYLGESVTGATGVVNYATKLIPAGKWVKALVIRTTGGQLSFYQAQAYYDTEEDAIVAPFPEKIVPIDTTTVNMAYVVYSAGTTSFANAIYDIRPLPFHYREGGQTGGGSTITSHASLSGLGADDHLQYLRTDGTRALTGIQRYQTHPTFTTNLDLVDKCYVDSCNALKLNTSAFNVYSGTTVPNTYETISAFNIYSGTTNSRLNGIDADVDYISGVTNNKLDESAFNIYSGTTIPNTYETISNFVSYTGVTKTSIDAKLNKTIFDIYTGTTVPNTYLSIGNFNAYSGATNTKINTKASLSGATFTGVIYAPTAILNSNTTQVATTAFVVGQAATAQPLMNGTSAIGSSLQYARQDHVHPKDTGKYDVSGGTISGSVMINNNLNVSGTSTLNTVNAVGTSTLNTLIINSGLAKYAADYSGTYDTRTLVDKNYVDTHPITYLNAVVAGAITTTSATDTLMTGMRITNVPAGTYLLSFGTTLSHSAGGALIYTSIYVGGTQQTASEMSWMRPNQAVITTHNYSNFVITLATTQTVEIRWRTTTATATARNRYLTLLKASSLT